MGIEDAMMTSVIERKRERELRWYENLFELMNDFSKPFQMYEHSPLDASIEVKKGGYIKVN